MFLLQKSILIELEVDRLFVGEESILHILGLIILSSLLRMDALSDTKLLMQSVC